MSLESVAITILPRISFEARCYHVESDSSVLLADDADTLWCDAITQGTVTAMWALDLGLHRFYYRIAGLRKLRGY